MKEESRFSGVLLNLSGKKKKGWRGKEKNKPSGKGEKSKT